MSQIVNIPDVLFFQEGPGVRKSQFTNKGVKLLNVGNINNNKINLSTTEKYISEEEAYGKYSHFLVDDGDLLIACSGIVVSNFHNKISFITETDLPLCLNTSTMRFKSLDENKLYINFFYYFLMTTSFKKQIGQLITGSAQLNFGPSHIQKIKMPLPPLQKQKQIAKTLDKAHELIELRTESIKKLDALAKSIFISMFIDNVNSTEWEIKEIQDLALKRKGSMRTGPFGSDLLHSEFVDDGVVSVLGIDNAVDNTFKWKQKRYITKKKYEKLKRYTIYPNDVIITIMGTVGRTAVIPNDIPLSINTKHLAAISFNQECVNSFFISYSLRENPMILNQIKNKTRGALMDGLNLSLIKSLSLSLPPLDLQNKFAKIIEKIEEQKTLYTQELEKLQTNFDALLQKSFQE
jgi:type I restriction enzyme, S subunit